MKTTEFGGFIVFIVMSLVFDLYMGSEIIRVTAYLRGFTTAAQVRSYVEYLHKYHRQLYKELNLFRSGDNIIFYSVVQFIGFFLGAFLVQVALLLSLFQLKDPFDRFFSDSWVLYFKSYFHFLPLLRATP